MYVLSKAWSGFRSFYGNSLFGIIFLIMVSGMLLIRKKRDQIYLFSVVSMILAGIIFFPLTAKILMLAIGAKVYWRMFWLLPFAPLFAWGLVSLCGKSWKRTALCVLCAAAILCNGRLVFTSRYFQPATNLYKLSDEVMEVVDAINEHAREHSIKRKRVAGTYGFMLQAREYDATIRQKYGRNVIHHPEKQTELYYQINKDDPDNDRIAYLAKKGKCRYLVLSAETDDPEALLEGGFDPVFENETYAVYYSRKYDRYK